MIPLRRLRSIVLSRHAAWASARVVLMATLALAAAPRAGAQWVNLGHSLSGGALTPALLNGIGPLLPNTGTKIVLADGLPFGTGTLVVGLTNISAPFKGGVIVPHPDILVPLVLDASGLWQIVFPWPAGVPAGLHLYWQAWMPDPGAPKGLAASNALESTAS